MCVVHPEYSDLSGELSPLISEDSPKAATMTSAFAAYLQRFFQHFLVCAVVTVQRTSEHGGAFFVSGVTTEVAALGIKVMFTLPAIISFSPSYTEG